MKILLIEDNPDHVYITERALRGYEHDLIFEHEENPAQALKRTAQETYDVILCDFRLPGTTGLDLLREIKKQEKDIPFVVITSSGDDRIAVELMKEGAADYIRKDESFVEAVPLVIRKVIEQSRQRQERRRIEEALKDSEQRYRMLVEHMPAVTYLCEINEDRSLIFISAQIEALLGIPAQACIDNPRFWSGHLYPDDRQRVLGELRSCHARLKPFVGEYRMVKQDGEVVWVQDSSFMTWDKEHGEVFYQGVMFNITEQRKARFDLEQAYDELKRTQEALIQSGKMAAVGQLATGISHELNQPLTGIKGFAQALMMDLAQESSLRQDVQRIIAQVDRMDTIIKNVRFFARKSEFRMEFMRVTGPIRDSLMLLTEQLRLRAINIVTDFEEGLPDIKGDCNQLQQAFINFITNARDAFDSVADGRGKELYIGVSAGEGRRSVSVVFRDNGCGISADNIKSIFDPFFTTKSPNGGIGLGLSIVYRIMEDHGATIQVKSKEGEGTEFTLLFPATPAG